MNLSFNYIWIYNSSKIINGCIFFYFYITSIWIYFNFANMRTCWK